MAISFNGQKRIRKTFGRIPEVAPMPNLIEVQRSSYDHFLQMGVTAENRANVGLQEVFKSVFPIRDFSERAQLEFVRYELETPKYDTDECQQRGITYAAPLKVTLRLVVWDVDEDTGSRSIRDIKEQDVYMGDMPLMTRNGTFIINGTERVIVSQMHRSPGVFFDHDKGKTHSSGKYLFAARVIPYRGSWLDFEFDAKDHLYVRIDRRRKLPATTLLLALDSAATEKLRAERAADGTALQPFEARDEVTEATLQLLADAGVPELPVLAIDHVSIGPYVRNTLALDKNATREDALIDIYRVMRPGEPPTLETAEALFRSLFFDSERYDLSAVGRVKINSRINQQTAYTFRTLCK